MRVPGFGYLWVDDVAVRDGQLNLEFSGENWAGAVSAIVAYPETKVAQGRRFLDFVKARRRFHFDNYFKRTLHPPTGEMPGLTDAERSRGFTVFARDWMRDVFYNDRPVSGERLAKLTTSAFAGE